MTHVVLYSKPGCHLCDDVKAVIERVLASSPGAFDFEIRNIEQNAADFAAYQYAIPVVTVDGVEVARYRMSEPDFRRALQARAR